MALHSNLFPRLVDAIRHVPGTKPLDIEGGSLNYVFMEKFTRYILIPNIENMHACLDLLNNMFSIGHGSLQSIRSDGRDGIRCEQASPGMHWVFTVASVLGGWLETVKNNQSHKELAAACRQFCYNELDLDTKFLFHGQAVIPAPRVKGGPIFGKPNEKQMWPVDGYRDMFVKLALGTKVKKPAAYWNSDQSIAVSCMRELIRLKIWTEADTVRAKVAFDMPLPRLYLPIHRRLLHSDGSDAGYIAWIDKTDEAVRAMGKDGCDWVRCVNDGSRMPGAKGRGVVGVTFGYDWSTPVPEG